MKKLKRSVLGLAVGGLFAVSCAHADTLLNPIDPSRLGFTFNNPSPSEGLLGRFEITNTTTNTSFLAFCLEVLQNVSSPAVYTEGAFSHPILQVQSDVQALFDQRYAGLETTGVARRVQEAAFQITLWEILDIRNASREAALTTGDLTGWAAAVGTSSVSVTETLNLARTWLTTLVDPTPGVATYTLTEWSNPTAQNLIQATAGPQAIPLPSTALLGLLGLAGLALMRRRTS